MLIGIEAERANHPEKTGVEHYAKQLILHLAKIDQKNHYRLYLRTQPESWFFSLPKNFEVKVIPFPKFWTQIRLSIELFFNPVDRLLVPASALPLYHPKKSVCTIHDAAFIYYPEADTWGMRNFLNFSYKFISWNAWRIISISESTKKDLIKHYGTPSEKIAVIHHGYEKNDSSGEVSLEVSKKLPENFVLFVSTLQPRKNLEGLIAAFKKFRSNHPELDYKLVVVGKPGWKYEPILESIKNNSDFVVYLGHVSNSDKWAIYRKAKLFVNASFYEGFGMWILEAFDASVPVAISDSSSLPEVAGDAAVYFDPHSTESMEKAIEKVLLNKELAETLVEKGKARLEDFSWDLTAEKTLKVLEGYTDDTK